MACGSCRRFVGVPFRPRRFSATPLDLAQDQPAVVDPLHPMGGFGDFGAYGAGGDAVYVVQPGEDVRLSAIAKKLGISVPEALTAAEQAAAPAGWAGWLGGAKLIAAANGKVWEGPPRWWTLPEARAGEQLVIPGEVADRAEKKTGAGWLLALAAGYLLFR